MTNTGITDEYDGCQQGEDCYACVFCDLCFKAEELVMPEDELPQFPRGKPDLHTHDMSENIRVRFDSDFRIDITAKKAIGGVWRVKIKWPSSESKAKGYRGEALSDVLATALSCLEAQ